MKKTITFILFFVGISALSNAQEKKAFIIPFEKNGLWGYMDESKKIIIAPQFQEAYPIYYERGRIKKKNKYGFIDPLGNIVIKPKYKSAEDFTMNGAKVQKGNRKYKIDVKGEIERSHIMGCGYASEYYYLSPHSKVTVFKNDDGKCGLIHRPLNKINHLQQTLDTIQPVFDTIVLISEMLFLVGIDNKFGFVFSYDLQAPDFILKNIKLGYDDIKLFPYATTGIALHNVFGLKKNGLWAYGSFGRNLFHPIEIMTEFKYLDVNSFVRPYAMVEYLPKKFGFINRGGQEFFMKLFKNR